MGKLTFLHMQHSKEIKDGKVVEHEEQIIEGDKGLTFKLFKKNDKESQKHHIKHNDDGTFTYKMMVGDKKNEMNNISVDELLKELKSSKDLKFVVDYVSSMKKKKGGAKKSSKKGSKKSSKKGSKKSSKKGSKKGSKKSSKKGSRKH